MKSGKRKILDGIELTIRKKSDRLEKRKITSTLQYWNRTSSYKRK